MAQVRRKSSGLRIGRSVVAVALSFAGLALAAAFLGITVQANALAREIAGVRAEIAAEQTRQAQLGARIAQQKTPDYVTQKARDYGYIGPNESLIAVQRGGQPSAPSSRVAAGPSRIARWIAFFFGTR